MSPDTIDRAAWTFLTTSRKLGVGAKAIVRAIFKPRRYKPRKRYRR